MVSNNEHEIPKNNNNQKETKMDDISMISFNLKIKNVKKRATKELKIIVFFAPFSKVYNQI